MELDQVDPLAPEFEFGDEHVCCRKKPGCPTIALTSDGGVVVTAPRDEVSNVGGMQLGIVFDAEQARELAAFLRAKGF